MHAEQRAGGAAPSAPSSPALPLTQTLPSSLTHPHDTHLQMGIGGPRPVTDSWEHMWWDNLQWKRWKIPRTGPAFPQDMYWQ